MRGTDSQIKERPILFSGPMVRAIFKGRKTQTRRVVKPQPVDVEDFSRSAPSLYQDAGFYMDYENGETKVRLCPYGQPGDRLWVRETFTAQEAGCCSSVPLYPPNDVVLYRADPMYDGMEPGDFAWGWTPAIYMPRKWSRLTLEITEVRVQRLQEITDGEVASEGVDWASKRIGNDHGSPARDAFAFLWDKLNNKRCPWSSNPWVWAITFKRSA